MSNVSYPKQTFFALYSDFSGKITIYIYGEFIQFNSKRFAAIPDQQTFVCLGTEWIVKNNMIEKV